MEQNLFKDFNLRSELYDNLIEIGYSDLTPIQAGTLPKILEGVDVIGQAKTGSGKTAAFGLGMLNKLQTEFIDPQGLILCPTRELADQVALELRKLARRVTNAKILTITGGVGYNHQERSLEHGAHIIVGTPGRVAKLIRTGYIKLSAITTFVLDEADRMLDMGFYDEIIGIERQLPRHKQNLLFSATFPKEIKNLSKDIQTDAAVVTVDSQHQEGDIEQYFYQLDSHKDKNKAVLKILGENRPERLIIFCKTKAITDKLAYFLNEQGIFTASFHGDIDQNERRKILTQFSNNSLSILVATDVAARGLDIKSLPVVINYDLPTDPEDYIHRIGRTGRAKEQGLAFSLLVEAEVHKLESIRELTKEVCIISSLGDLSDIKSYDLLPPMETIFISGGKKDKLRPGDILGALVKEAGLDASDVGDIAIMPVLSYVAIKKHKTDLAIEKLNQGKIKKRSFRVGLVQA